MALLQCQFFAESLGVQATMNVILPQRRGRPPEGGHPVLYLLHGNSDDHSMWIRRTSVERYAEARGLAVVMPAVNRSYYTDMAYGPNYWTFVSEELPETARSFFPIAERREGRFVAGLSMGGYGAFKLALRHPDRFAAAASLSGALDVYRMWDIREADMKLIFGKRSRIRGSDDDLFALARKRVEEGATLPKLYQCCGTEDFLYRDNIRFRAHAERLGCELTYREEAGDHEWSYWDRNIERVIQWLPLP
ncbi:esterase family protein [Paenibacillus antri]|uniref:Esterase family protein n=1 Tax=Paenibacillus antri TaxID=2582848 RepID=A0A5R9G380_9BACL|nr:alpha/beta hydrolase family protein [Paenibacillus antri]TLS50291.1 esterase family protein [Paenibacillus antri]